MSFRKTMTGRSVVRAAVATMVLAILWSGPRVCMAQSADDGAFAADDGALDADDDTLAVHKAEAELFFQERVKPFIKTYCLECHQNRRPTEAGLSFTPALQTPGHAAFSEKWKKAAARVNAHDMPPDGLEQPTEEEREMFLSWLGMVKYLSPRDPGPFIIRRLTKTEYGNTLHDLFGVEPKIADSLPDEVSGEGYLNSLSSLQLEQYLLIAEEVLDEVVVSDDLLFVKLEQRFPGEPPASTENARERVFRTVESITRKTYRRPASDAELNVLMDVFDLGRENELSEAAAMRLLLKAILVSPQFLFITPAEEPEATAEIVPLDDYQLASRLSYLLWATMPDDELMTLAEAGTLHELPILKAQVKRMLEDHRCRALFDGFGAQWLKIGDLDTATFDPSLFPEMTDQLRSAMYDEARIYFETAVRENLSVASLIESDYTFLNQDLAAIYGLEDTVVGPEMRRVRLTDPHRGGLLGMPAVLAATSFPNRTSPVNRGVWVLEQVLGEHVPAAPPDVPALEEQSPESFAGLTLRERTELHRSNAVCANCHRLLDPIGFGLENFDAIGRWRVQDDNGAAIDASGELPGGEHFSSPQELKAIISGRLDDVSRNLIERLLAYAICRRLEGYDEIVVDELMQLVAEDGYRMQTLITAVVTSFPFTHRRIE